MPRPHGLPRWVLLALACAAFFAVAMIPRGVVRTIEASHLPDSVPAQAGGASFEAPAQQQGELPGVRAVVSREERADTLLASTVDALVPGTPSVHDAGPTPGELSRELAPAAPQPDAAPSGSRAPPPSI